MIGERTIWVAALPSTNQFLKENWQRLPNGTVVVAEYQSAGRGRYNRFWHSPEGGLWFSVLFKPRKQIKPIFFTKLCSVAIVRALSSMKIDVRIKWPNDLYYDKKKLAGILTEGIFEENTLRAVIVGIGINVNNDIPKELKYKAIALSQILSRTFDLKVLLKMILKQVNQLLKRYWSKPEALTRVWKGLLLQKEGMEVSFIYEDQVKTGKIVRIEDDKIHILTEGQELSVSSLEILDS
ncbi:biotin--[acetyl-CoA-carboxylase] ligase [Pseudothermotoga sp. U03pept]|uniref:biotin--[acetyl-CoA-carboxylase] ligase n=1 Tax=Pseudothermotoga sp. U03pept TaxID=3447012 RepID=UPI003F0FB359